MARTLKFRQPRFDSKGKFKDWFYWGFIDGGFISPLKIGGDDYQFTGLLDKNKREIFEGDIVKGLMMGSTQKILGEIKFQNGCFRIFEKNEYMQPILWSHFYDLEIEIIGNIYKNPELLK